MSLSEDKSIMKNYIAILCLLVSSHNALAQEPLRQRLPYEYDLLDAIFDVYGHHSTVYTVGPYALAPFVILVPADVNYDFSEILCEETTSYHIFSHVFSSDKHYGTRSYQTRSG